MPIRILLPNDASAFQAIRLRGLAECPTAFSSSHEEEVGIPPSVVASRLAAKPDGAVFGSFVENELAGVIGIQREGRHKLTHKAFIWGMYVAPEHRLKGVGRTLVTTALQHAKRELGVRVVKLGVNTLNAPAISLYEAMGFHTYGTERGFLQVGGVLYDEHLMSCLIADAV
jgi:ribosomal protein S18 acetylase RimI-like enzyme